MAKKTSTTDKHFPIVGIGGSAGAIEAIIELAQHLTTGTGMAFVYMQHQTPDYDSKLPSLLAKKTKLPVLEAEDGMSVEPDFLYVVPPGKEITVADGQFRVAQRPVEGYDYMPINRFFSSLADTYKEYAIGVVLSGADGDGAQGIKAIKIAGGLTFAQDATAHFQSMPKTAVAEGAVDLVLPPREIAEELIAFSRHEEAYYRALQDIDGESISNRDEDLVAILQMVHKASGVDFNQYKISTIKRRIIRRMVLHRLNTLSEYVHRS